MGFRNWPPWFMVSGVSKKTGDPLVAEIRHALMPGRFVKWDAVSGLVENLDQVRERVEASVKAGEAKRAVRLYEVLLTGVYAKIEEADDECDLANLFHRLMCGWIQARRVHAATGEELESLSHYCTEPAAKGLAKRDAFAAAKLYRALGLRIVNAGKSKYYKEALGHFENARDLYCATGHAGEWQSLIEVVRVAHSRKSGFLSAFERIVSRKPYSSSYAEEARVRWKRLTS